MSLAGKTVLVTGASGFLGGEVVRRTAAEGAYVLALVRSPQKASHLRDTENVEVVQGDITDAGRMREVLQRGDYVLHTAVNYGNWDEQHRVNAEGTRSVMRAAAQGRVQRFVHCSSIVVYGYRRTGRIFESDPLMMAKYDPYSVSKIKAEDAVREIGAQTKLSYAIIRPGMIYGPRSGQWTDFAYQFTRRRPLIWIGDGSGNIFPIHVEDVADMMCLAATHPQAHNEAFTCVSDEQVTWRDYLAAFAKLSNNPTYFGVPLPLVNTAAAIAAVLGRGRIRDAPEFAGAIKRQAVMDMSKARERLDWQPKYNLERGMQTVIPYLREKGWLN